VWNISTRLPEVIEYPLDIKITTAQTGHIRDFPEEVAGDVKPGSVLSYLRYLEIEPSLYDSYLRVTGFATGSNFA
jgi:hypothetical protein